MNRRSYRILSLCLFFSVATILLASCQQLSSPASIPTYEPITIKPNAAFKLRVGQEAIIEGRDMRIRFIAVDRDARCPNQVQCSEDGPALLRIDVVHPDGHTSELTLDANPPNPATALAMVEEFSIRAARLAPLAETPEQQVPTEEYVATLVVRIEE